jgi:hypothetical protein
VPADPADPIAAVVARMEDLAGTLTATDGVARFNHLYLEVTRSTDATLSFEDRSFLAALDVSFAGLYFAAVDAAAAGRPTARCWAPLIAARYDARIAPIQFALAGMNAHINHDLALSLVATSEQAGIDLAEDSPQHRDYLKMNDVLAAVEARVKAEFLTGLVGLADRVLRRIDDVIAMWSVVEARKAAWTNAEILWSLGSEPRLSAAFADALDGSVGFASRGLLVPTLA